MKRTFKEGTYKGNNTKGACHILAKKAPGFFALSSMATYFTAVPIVAYADDGRLEKGVYGVIATAILAGLARLTRDVRAHVRRKNTAKRFVAFAKEFSKNRSMEHAGQHIY